MGASLWTFSPQSQGLFVHETGVKNVTQFTPQIEADLLLGDDSSVGGLAWLRAFDEPIDGDARKLAEAFKHVVREHRARFVSVVRVLAHTQKTGHFLGFFRA